MNIFRKTLVLLLGAFLCQGCTPIIHMHGNILSEKMLSALEIGAHTEDHIADFLGPPTTVTSFNKHLWIYTGKKTETTSFFEPVILEQSTIILEFDSQEILRAIYKIDMTKAISITPLKYKTPTGGHDISFLQELFGSFGLFHRPTGLQE